MNQQAESNRPSDAEAIEATAAAWLAQRDAGLTPEEAADFARWRAADARHAAAVARLERSWSMLQQLHDFRPEAVAHPDRDLLRQRIAGSRRPSWSALAATAVLAACLSLSVVWWWRSAEVSTGPEFASQRFATTVDGYERVVLSDGSSVELNAASEVRVHYASEERRVQLVRGEAHFTVAKDARRPFRVEAGGVAVRAVGTAFNVRLGVREIEVLVTEGRVAVAAHSSVAGFQAQPVGAALSADAAADAGATSLASVAEVSAQERLVLPAAGAKTAAEPVPPPRIEKVSAAAVRLALAWQGPRLVFVDTPLAQAIAQFNRRNAVQLELADAELESLPIGGSFRAENVEGFVRLLVSSQDIAVERPDPLRIVVRKGK